MKPEFSQVLLPGARIITGSSSSSSNKWLALMTAVFAVSLTSMIVFYEIKFAQYEVRVSIMEEELSNFIKRYDEGKVLEQYYETEFANVEDEELEDDEDELQPYGELKLEDEDESSESQSQRGRSKRQIPVPVEAVYDPSVPRTSDGVPILDNSYLGRIGVPTPGYVHFSNIHPTHDSEGLRLYESLIATGGRGEPRSPDYYPPSTAASGILPHHRTSAAWVEKPETRRGVQLKSGDTDPQSSDDLFYTRSGTSSGSGHRGSYAQQRSSSYRAGTSSVSQQGGEGGNDAGITGGASSSFFSTSGGSGSTTSHLSGSGAGGNTVINRRSRVPATGDFLYPQNTRVRNIQYPPLKRIGQGDGEVVARVLQADNESESDSARPSGRVRAHANLGETAGAQAESRRSYKGSQNLSRGQHGQGQKRHAARSQRRQPQQQHGEAGAESDEVNLVRVEAWVEGPKAVAAHYEGDASNFTIGHPHYAGNGKLRNVNGIFTSWKLADWMVGNEASKHAFSLNRGVVTINHAGLYYIYAQIHYIDVHDINAFHVKVNSDPFIQCTTTLESTSSSIATKSHTCFTSGVTLLQQNDKVSVEDIESDRFSIFSREKSFFGLMKLGGGVEIPQKNPQ